MKKVFRIQTTCHPNAAYGQVGQVHQWLADILTQIARQTASPNDQNRQGISVDVIVEVLE